MDLLVEAQIKDNLPVSGTWRVPNLSVSVLLPITHLFRSPDMEWEWIEENVFRAYKNDEGEIRLQFPMHGVKDFKLLAFCVARIMDGMISAILDTEWGMEYWNRLSKTKGGKLWTPENQMRGRIKL